MFHSFFVLLDHVSQRVPGPTQTETSRDKKFLGCKDKVDLEVMGKYCIPYKCSTMYAEQMGKTTH